MTAHESAWALVERGQRGDTDALAELYLMYRPYVLRYFRYRVRSPQLVEDLAADVWLRVLRRLDSFHDDRGADFGAVLSTIARNLLTDHVKSACAQRDTLADDEWIGDILPVAPSAEDVALNDVAVIVGNFDWSGLTLHQRQAVVLRVFYGLTPGDAAKVLGLGSPQSVTQLRRRGLAQLRKQLS